MSIFRKRNLSSREKGWKEQWKGWFYEKGTTISCVLESLWKDWGSPRLVSERADKETKGAIKWIEIISNCENVFF